MKMQLKHVCIPLTITSAFALAGWVVLEEPTFVESTAAAISIDPSEGLVESLPPSVVVGESNIEIDPGTGFAMAAFPPTIPDRQWHEDAWTVNNCLDCHETGVEDAPVIRHIGLPDITYQSKCRTCHVLIPGDTEYNIKVEDPNYASWAFPPMMPNNEDHDQAWGKNDCMLCHEDGVRDATLLKHEGLPRIVLKAKCRTCHVQPRSHTTSPWDMSAFEDLFD